MIRSAAIAAVSLLLFGAGPSSPSGLLGVYGIIERVTFEPSGAAPERIRLYGAFAFVQGGVGGTEITTAARGVLYFRIPPRSRLAGDSLKAVTTIRAEWADLAAVAGTGQAVGFASYRYGFLFRDIVPTQPVPVGAFGGDSGDLVVRPDSATLRSPAYYVTNTGVVKLIESGSHASVVAALKRALAAGR